MNEYKERDAATVEAMFDSIASGYDKTNSIMSFRLHKSWNRKLISLMSKQVESRATLLDLCAGTGEIALGYLQQAAPSAKAYLLDFSQEMLACARSKANRLHLSESYAIEYLVADAEKIPLPNDSVDAITVAYGIRNICDREKCILDAYRVLKPGGSFGILELTRPNNRVVRLGHSLYLNTFVPIATRICTKNQKAYKYLSSSIKEFIAPKELETTLRSCGFEKTERIPLNGGIATIILAHKAL